MKNFKKIFTLCTALLLTLGLAGACAPTDTDSPENSESQSVSAHESSVPEAEENSSASTPEEPEQPDEPEEKVQYEEVGYFTQNVLPCEYTSFSHELDAGIYYVTSYNDYTVFTDFSAGVFAELSERGTFEFDVCYSDWAADFVKEVEIDYYIYKIIPYEMAGAEGTATLLADGAITPVNVTLAEAGVYSFTVNQEVSFFSGMSENEFLAFQNYYTLFADEANTQATLYIGGLESAYGDVELTFGLEKVTPVAVTEETQALSLMVAGDNAFAFTAEENGAYRIDFDSDNLAVAAFDSETGAISYLYGSDYLEFDYAGTPVVFFAKYAGYDNFVSPYESSVTITRVGDVGYRSPVAPEELYLTPAFPQESVVPANSVEQNIPLVVNVSAMGELSISWDNDKVKVYVGETLIEKGYEFTVEDRYSAPQFTVHNETATDQPVTFTLTDNAAAESAVALKLGANAITVTAAGGYAKQTECTFTAEKAGKYRLSVADGEENADVYDKKGDWIEILPYEFSMESNGSITFLVASLDATSITTDEINLIIEYFDEATQTWVQE